MQYPRLPAVGEAPLPALPFHASPNQSSRGGRRPRLVFLHTWGGGSFDSVRAWLSDPEAKASAHVVYGGTLDNAAGAAVQLVPWAAKAWTECELNPVGISVECADAIWRGHDAHGFAQLARIVAFLCLRHLDACRPVDAHGIVAGTHGFTRHADAGALGCGHLACPTTDLQLWRQFASRVVAEYRHGGFRDRWGK